MLDKYLRLLLQFLIYLPQCGTSISKRTEICISRVYDTRNFNPQKILSRVWEKLWFIPSCLPNNILHAPTALIEGSGGEEDSCHATSGVLYAGVAADYLQRVSFVGWACHFRSKQIWHSGSLKHGEWFHKTGFYICSIHQRAKSRSQNIFSGRVKNFTFE